MRGQCERKHRQREGNIVPRMAQMNINMIIEGTDIIIFIDHESEHTCAIFGDEQIHRIAHDVGHHLTRGH